MTLDHPLKGPTPFVLLSLAAAAIGSGIYFLWTSLKTNGGFGFPLDDPWIHLQFAKNLVEHGSFSYFRNEMVTSGSTAPLYTLLLAAGFLVTDNEMILSYVLGILAHTGLAVLMFFLARRLFDGEIVAAAGAGLLAALEPRLVHASVSGMETGLFAALLAGSFLAYETKRPVWLGLLLGGALWTRPEAILFAAVLGADVLLQEINHRRSALRRAKQKKSVRRPGIEPSTGVLPPHLKKATWIFAALTGVYVAWNLLLSGSILPNTYAAKVRYYSGASPGYLLEVAGFIADGPRLAFALFCLVGTGGVVMDFVRGRRSSLRIPVLFAAAMVAAYWYALPHLYQEGRYLMPVLPFLALLAVQGVRVVAGWAGGIIPASGRERWSRPLTAALLLVTVLLAGVALPAQSSSYTFLTKYIADRQVRTARWIAEHLPADAVVATHDIGAIGYYSGRRVVDMVGLVSPGMIRHIGSFAGLSAFLGSQGVTHLALLRNWFEVANQTPLFQTDEGSPEILEVFAFRPQRTRFVGQDVSRGMAAAAQMLAAGRGSEAVPLLDQLLRAEPSCARLHYLSGVAARSLGRYDRADLHFREALRLQPDHREAAAERADLERRKVTDTLPGPGS